MNGTTEAGSTLELIAGLSAAASPLPVYAAWPQSLRTAVDIISHTPMPMLLLWGPQLCQLYNDSLARLIGNNHPRAFGQPVDAIWPELQAFTAPVYAAVMAGEVRTFHEKCFYLPHGPRRVEVWLDLTYSPVRDESGAVAGILVTLIEANERRQLAADLQRTADASQDAQRQVEERLQLALEATDAIGTWDWNIQTDIFMADAHFAQLHSVDPLQAGVLPITAYLQGVHPEDRGSIARSIGHCIAQGHEYSEEYRLLQADGSVRWVLARGRCYRNEDGHAARFVGASIDITERKRIEQSLRESETYFRLAIELSPALHWTADANGQAHLPTHGERWRQLTHVEGHEVEFTDWATVVHPDDYQPTLDTWYRAIATGAPYDAQYRLRMADGNYRWMHARALPLLDAAGEVKQWFGMTEDIDNRRRIEQAVRDLNETLEQRVGERTRALAQLNVQLQAEMQERERAEEALRHAQKMEALGQLTGGIAHDFNNMLTGIIGSLDLMQRYIAKGRASEIGRFTEAAVTSANRAAALTHRLLAFSRRQSLDRRPLDPNQLLGSLEDLFRRTQGEHITLHMQLAEGIWAVNTDASQLENALLNLVINARDAMPGGGTLNIETANCQLDTSPDGATLDPVEPGDYVMISVSDDGAGMSAPVLSKAFDPFFTTKPIGQGTGLGLSMIYGFAKQSGGQVTLHSREGEGTCVRLYLPRHLAVIEQPGLAPTPAAAPLAKAGESVLVVEDDPAVRMLVLNVLDELGYQALPAADAESALALLESPVRIDLLVTDVGLPGLNGRQLAEIARQYRPGLRVLFMTGYAQSAAERQAFLGEGMDLLAKPFTLDHLALCLRGMIGR
ncbi:PAS domain-containing protein [Pseudomonas sp. nanlin1]|uniref:PAS domain-containing hybrid sensor histidine kinase/response regulator n=1 Tax=Pseudomonas sp. nanlin1 TaxID=3040605 RepID=UPI0038910055